MYIPVSYTHLDVYKRQVVHTLILIDESHRWVNTKKQQALELISVYFREARKYFGGIGLASHNARDFVPEGTESAVDKMKTLFELSQYKFVFHQDESSSEPVSYTHLYLGLHNFIPDFQKNREITLKFSIICWFIFLILNLYQIYKFRAAFSEEGFNLQQRGSSRWTTPEEIQKQYT